MNTPYALGKHPGKDPVLFTAFRPMLPPSQLPSNWSYEYLEDDIDDQGQVGTCVAHGCAAIGEMYNFKRHETRIEMSRIAIYSQGKHSYEPDNIDQQGLYISDGLKVLQTFGYVPEQKLPYNPDPQAIVAPVPVNLWQKDFMLHDFAAVPNDVESMRVAMLQHGPIIMGISWANSWFNPSSDGTLPTPDSAAGGHCVVIVGYSDKRAAFRIRNSWGRAWGDGGHAWLPYLNITGQWMPDNLYTVRA